MDYPETKDLIYKPKRFIVVKVALFVINTTFNIITGFIKFFKTTIIFIKQNKHVFMRYVIRILVYINNIFRK